MLGETAEAKNKGPRGNSRKQADVELQSIIKTEDEDESLDNTTEVPWYWDTRYPLRIAYSRRWWANAFLILLWMWAIAFILADYIASPSWSDNILFLPAYIAASFWVFIYVLDVWRVAYTKGDAEHKYSKRVSEIRGTIAAILLLLIYLYVDSRSTHNSNQKWAAFALAVFLASYFGLFAYMNIPKKTKKVTLGYGRASSNEDGS